MGYISSSSNILMSVEEVTPWKRRVILLPATSTASPTAGRERGRETEGECVCGTSLNDYITKQQLRNITKVHSKYNNMGSKSVWWENIAGGNCRTR